jgi:tetratricopeptide (TPR) repeat protein
MTMLRAWIVVGLLLANGCRDHTTSRQPETRAVANDAGADISRLRMEIDRLDRAGELERATQLARRVVELVRVEDPAALAAALETSGRLLLHSGRWRDAEAAFGEALQQKTPPIAKQLRASLLWGLGSVYAHERRNDEAIPRLQESLALTEEMKGRDSIEAANTMEVHAAAYDYAGRYRDAEALFRRAIAINEKLSTGEPVDRGRPIANLALNLEYQKRDDDALVEYRRALPLVLRAEGYERTGLAEVQAGIARILHRANKLKDAEASYREGLATRRSAVGDEHPSVAMDYHNLAVVLRDQRRFADAADACVRSKEMRAKLLAADHPHRVETDELCNELGEALKSKRRR